MRSPRRLHRSWAHTEHGPTPWATELGLRSED